MVVGMQTVAYAATGLLSLTATVVLPYAATQLKKLIDAHVDQQKAQTLNDIVDGLTSIIAGVVQRFNQQIVADAKQYGTWTPGLKDAVKQAAIEAVKSQGAALVALAEKVGVDIESFIADQIDAYVREHHIPTVNKPDQQPNEQPAQTA